MTPARSNPLQFPAEIISRLQVGMVIDLPKMPSPWCDFEYEVTKIRKETVSLRVVR
jgi:hypothetical protein